MIVTVIGARPQFVKAAILSRELKKAGIEEQIIHTGQHYDYKMSEVFFHELSLPGANINLNAGSGSHAAQTAQMLTGIADQLEKKKKDVSQLLLYGDTNSTLAGALAASKLNIPIIHVEAGLRSFNRTMPEEINRVITDHLSSLLFCSSPVGKENLRKDGITKGVHISGDIMLDAFETFSEIAIGKVKISDVLPPKVAYNYILLTIHRPVNTDNFENLKQIIAGLGMIDNNVVWPVHPRNKQFLKTLELPANVHVFDPFSYFEMLVVLKGASKVLTDSGGLQKEAYWAKKPCITIRSETEWVETLHDNWNMLVDANSSAIKDASAVQVSESSWKSLYGDGKAGEKIAQIIATA